MPNSVLRKEKFSILLDVKNAYYHTTMPTSSQKFSSPTNLNRGPICFLASKRPHLATLQTTHVQLLEKPKSSSTFFCAIQQEHTLRSPSCCRGGGGGRGGLNGVVKVGAWVQVWWETFYSSRFFRIPEKISKEVRLYHIR